MTRLGELTGDNAGLSRKNLLGGSVFLRKRELTMRHALPLALAVVFSLTVLGQDQLPTFTGQSRSAFVWGEDSPNGAVSSSIQDPLTGTTIAQLSYGGIQVSSRMGFELVGHGEAGEFLNYSSTIVNSTDAPLLVRYGGASIDGRNLIPLSIAPTKKDNGKKQHQSSSSLVELGKMYCFMNGFVSEENLLLSETSSLTLNVTPGTALTMSFVFKDPRQYSVRCSVDGCHPTGTIRYHLTVNGHDYVFVWPGRSVVYCGK